jgi:hypothetical protein
MNRSGELMKMKHKYLKVGVILAALALLRHAYPAMAVIEGTISTPAANKK